MNHGRRGGPRALEKVSSKDLKIQIKKIFKSLKPYYFILIITLILAIFGSIFTIIGPNKLTKITDTIVEGIIIGINLEYVKKLTISLLVLYLFSFVFSYLKDVLMSYVTQRFTRNLRMEIINKLNVLPLSYFDKNETGDILSKVSNDVDTVSQTLDQSIGGLTTAIVTLIGVLIMMFKTNVIMTITTILSTLIGIFIMLFIVAKSQKYFTIAQTKLGELYGHIEEIYSSLNVVRTYNGEEETKKTFNDLNDDLAKTAYKGRFLGGLMPQVMNFIGNFSYVSVVIVGSILVMDNKITFGVIIAYMLYTRLFSSPLSTISQSINSLQQTAAASKRVFDFLEEDEESKDIVKNNLKVTNALGKVEFKNVTFSYNGKTNVIKNFSSKFNPGTKIAIVGPTGAGKTTLVNLLMKFYEINSGSILIDDIDIKDLSKKNIHELFTMVLQDTWLFKGTVKENIIFNQKNITEKQLLDASKKVGLHHTIKTLPKGYDTMLDDNDILSVGEKQLLTIARGMLEGSPLLILDEATSNVDVRTEQKVQRAMDELMKDKTSFVIAHRLSTIKNADVILVIDNGNIKEQGSHEELMKQKGFYYDLYNSQFENN